jgi:TPR repeat protein
MKRTVVTLSLCLTLGLAAAPAQAQGQKLAFLVGVKKYSHPNLTQLRYSENDVAELGRLLEKGGYNVTLLTDSTGAKNPALQPTKANVERQLTQMLARCKSRDDSVLVAFAGHGLQFEGQNDAFFCPQDAKPFVEQTATLVSLGHVYKELDQCFAGIKVLLVDACRNDPKLGRGVNGDRSPRAPRGVAVMFSCAAGEVAYEDAKYQHGVFFHFVLEGLRGKAKNGQGKVTFTSLADYVSAEVSQTVPKVIGQGAQQSPNFKADIAGASPVLLTSVATSARYPRLGELCEPVRGSDAARWGLTPAGQQQVLFVVPGGGADLMGLRAGDVVLKINDREVAWPQNMHTILKGTPLGASLAITVLREGRQMVLNGVYASDFDATEDVQRLMAIAPQDRAAQHMLGVCYQNGHGVSRSDGEAVQWYRKAAELGYAPSQTSLAWMYENGRGVARDYAVALDWYRKAAAQGHARAQASIGYMVLNGRGVTKNDNEAMVWLRRAADQGHSSAQNTVGWNLRHARGTTRNDVEAVSWFKKSAAQGNAVAQCNLGWMYENGWGVAKDHAEALRWYRASADQGDSMGRNNLGVMYANGWAIAKDESEAVSLFKKAAEQGNSTAQTNLAWRYANGRGVTQDLAEAVKWYRKAADQNNARAQNELGELFEDGKGVAKSYGEAIKLFRKAAEQGNSAAEYNLARMYEGGVGGLVASTSEALNWYRKAADHGNARAKKALQRLGQA